MARDALRRRAMFNVIDMRMAWTIDLVVRRERPFSIGELARRVTTTVGDFELQVATAEDTIIAKLEWAKAGSSERQLLDVAKVLRTRAGHSTSHTSNGGWTFSRCDLNGTMLARS